MRVNQLRWWDQPLRPRTIPQAHDSTIPSIPVRFALNTNMPLLIDHGDIVQTTLVLAVCSILHFFLQHLLDVKDEHGPDLVTVHPPTNDQKPIHGQDSTCPLLIISPTDSSKYQQTTPACVGSHALTLRRRVPSARPLPRTTVFA